MVVVVVVAVVVVVVVEISLSPWGNPSNSNSEMSRDSKLQKCRNSP